MILNRDYTFLIFIMEANMNQIIFNLYNLKIDFQNNLKSLTCFRLSFVAFTLLFVVKFVKKK